MCELYVEIQSAIAENNTFQRHNSSNGQIIILKLYTYFIIEFNCSLTYG